MRLSLIIPTYNGAHKVVHVLDSILKQNTMPDELILVVDGSTDNTIEVVEQYKTLIPNFKIIEQSNQGRAGVRNTGAKAAQNELLLFLDDDMIAPPELVEMHKAHHQKYSGSLVSGRLDQMLVTHEETEFDVFEKWQNGRWNQTIADTKTDEIELTTPYVTANNFSIAKADFEVLGMFDIRLKDAEDYDFAVIAQRYGKKLFLSNQCWAWHNDFLAKNFFSYVKRMRQYNFAQRELVRLKPELHGDPKTNKRYPIVPGGIKAFFFKLLVRRFFINSMDNGFWRFLPINIRCKIYDYIITANGTYFPKIKL